MNLSPLFTLGKNDFVKGLVVAVITGVLTLLVQMLSSGNVDLKQLGVAALIAGCSYLLKNFSTDSNGKLLGKVQIE